MKCTVAEVKDVIQRMLTESREELWSEVDTGDFKPNLKRFPAVAYHGTSPESAKQMLKGFKTEGIDLAFVKSAALTYGTLKSPTPIILEITVRKLRPFQWGGAENERDGIVMNYDIGEDGFTFFGEVPKDAVRVVKVK